MMSRLRVWVSRRRSSLAPAWRRRIRPRARLLSQLLRAKKKLLGTAAGKAAGTGSRQKKLLGMFGSSRKPGQGSSASAGAGEGIRNLRELESSVKSLQCQKSTVGLFSPAKLGSADYLMKKKKKTHFQWFLAQCPEPPTSKSKKSNKAELIVTCGKL